VVITVSQLAESRRLASFTVGLDMTTKLEHRVPPPILWAQNPCFLEVTRRVALQNIENNEVPCKIFLAKELRAVLASAGSMTARKGRAGTIGGLASEDYCAQSGEIICNHLRWGSRSLFARTGCSSWSPTLQSLQRRRLGDITEQISARGHPPESDAFLFESTGLQLCERR
jgi:hypothetical protein